MGRTCHRSAVRFFNFRSHMSTKVSGIKTSSRLISYVRDFHSLYMGPVKGSYIICIHTHITILLQCVLFHSIKHMSTTNIFILHINNTYKYI
jgi:hypothetical protein